MPVSVIGALNVKVANRDKVSYAGRVPEVTIQIGQEYLSDCYAIPLDGYNLVLGMTFLCSLGPILWDFDVLYIAFWRGGRRILWQGVESQRGPKNAVSSRAVHTDGQNLMDRIRRPV